MHGVVLPEIGPWEAWRDAARGRVMAGVPSEAVLRRWGAADGDLFASDTQPVPAPKGPAPTVPKAFLSAAKLAVRHRDPERFAHAYGLLWRLQHEKGLMSDRADDDVARIEAMAKAVSRDAHKMKAFVRFRDIEAPEAERRSFATWVEPGCHALQPTAPFFVRRFSDLDWRIVTPDKTAIFEDGTLRFAPGQPKPPQPRGFGPPISAKSSIRRR